MARRTFIALASKFGDIFSTLGKLGLTSRLLFAASILLFWVAAVFVLELCNFPDHSQVRDFLMDLVLWGLSL